MNCISLTDNHSRIEFKCTVFNERFHVWVDTGSPNTLVFSNFISTFNLNPAGTQKYNGKVAGKIFQNKYAVTIPEIIIPNCLPLRNIRAITALEGPEWNNIIILGLNVLNHLSYKITRETNTLEWLESLTSTIPNSERSKFNHIIINGRYMLTDDNEE